MLRVLTLMAAACSLAGCLTTASPDPPPEMPQNYRALIVEKAKEFFFDPYSIREPIISTPFTYSSLTGGREAVCVRLNAKNRLGGYIGLKYYLFAFSGGQVSNVYDAYIDSNCTGLQYTAFTELESGGTPVVTAPAKR